jgi:hypothetical protein
VRFAERFPTEGELCDGITQFSWYQVTRNLKAEKEAAQAKASRTIPASVRRCDHCESQLPDSVIARLPKEEVRRRAVGALP